MTALSLQFSLSLNWEDNMYNQETDKQIVY